MILSDERYKALLRGDKPINKDEEIWLENFNKRMDKVLEKDKIEQEIYFKNKTNAYREYYALLMSILPKDFLYKEPFSVDELESIASKIEEKADEKMWKIFLNPVLRKLNGLPLKWSPFPDHEKLYMTEITNKFICQKLKKQFNIDAKSLEKKYNSYITKEFVKKIQEIEKKYDIMLDYEFNPYDYLSNWEYYNV